MIKRCRSVYLFTVILPILLLASPSILLASPHSMCGEWRKSPELQGRSVNSVLTHASVVFVATDAGVFKSEDGLSWLSTPLSLPAYSLATYQGGLLAGTEDGVYLSMDGGVTWGAVGLKGKRVTALAVSGGVIYAGTDDGVYKKAGEGGWKATPLRGHIKSLAADPSNPDIVFAGTGGGVLAGWGDLYASTDGGSSWSRAWLSNATSLALIALLPVAGAPLYYEVASIAVNPCNPREVYAGARLVFTAFLVIPMEAGALHVSHDYGASWSIMGPGLKCVFAVRFENCKALILGTSDGVYTSEDGGKTWLHLSPANETVRAVGYRGVYIYAGTPSGLLTFHRKTYTTSVSLKVETSRIPPYGGEVRFSGDLASEGRGLPFKNMKVLFNGVEAGSCRTDTGGGYACSTAWPATRAKTVNLTVLFPGDPCYERSLASRLFHLVNATTAHGSALGAGWYEEGSTATISVAPTAVREGFIEYTFMGWRARGVILSADPTLTITVREPVEVEAVWGQKLSAVALAILAAAAASLLLAVILILGEKRRSSSSPKPECRS